MLGETGVRTKFRKIKIVGFEIDEKNFKLVWHNDHYISQIITKD